MLENPYFHNEDAKQERCYWRRVFALAIAALFTALTVGAVLGMLLYSGKAGAEAKMKAEEGGIVVILYDDPCKFKIATNMPYRATWTENGKVLEGCAGLFPQLGIEVLYFEDKSIVPIPMPFFSQVTES